MDSIIDLLGCKLSAVLLTNYGNRMALNGPEIRGDRRLPGHALWELQIVLLGLILHLNELPENRVSLCAENLLGRRLFHELDFVF